MALGCASEWGANTGAIPSIPLHQAVRAHSLSPWFRQREGRTSAIAPNYWLRRSEWTIAVAMNDRAYRSIGIVGAGRVAQALAVALAPHSAAKPLVWARSLQRAGIAADMGGGEAATLDRLAAECNFIAIAVSDDAVAAVAAAMARCMPAAGAPFIFHVSGRSGAAILDPLRAAGAVTAAIHPAMTFVGDPHAEARRMADARFAITGSTADATARARALVERLGGVAVEIAEDRRALYHAGLCHASNHLVTLIAGAADILQASGVEDPAALLAPLVRAALENSLTLGFGGLSGPLLRGDARTVEGHLETLAAHCPDALPAYRAMARATLDELEQRGSPGAPSGLRERLG